MLKKQNYFIRAELQFKNHLKNLGSGFYICIGLSSIRHTLCFNFTYAVLKNLKNGIFFYHVKDILFFMKKYKVTFNIIRIKTHIQESEARTHILILTVHC